MTSPAPQPEVVPPREAPPDTSLLRLAAAVVRRWRLVIGVALLAAIGTAVWSLLVTPRFEAGLEFAPEERPIGGALSSLPAGLGGFASQLGLGSLGESRSLSFYADLLKGRSLLEQLALDSFPDPARAGARRSLVEILGQPGKSPAWRLYQTVEFLQHKAVSTRVNDRTGTVAVSVTLSDPRSEERRVG